jgi:hypothetical protein
MMEVKKVTGLKNTHESKVRMITKGILQDLLLKKQTLLVEAVMKNRFKIITMT